MNPLGIEQLDNLVGRLGALLERASAAERRFLTVDGAADYSGLSSESVRRLLAAGRLTALRPVKGRIVIDRHELDAYVLGCNGRPRSGRGRRVRG